MILNAIGKGLYPDYVGRRMIFTGSGSGPTLYVPTTGDPVTLGDPRLYIDAMFGGAMSVSGNYFVRPQPAGTGVRQTWALRWFLTNGTEAGAINLSAEQVQLGCFVGQF
jgi:hypothetical protein